MTDRELLELAAKAAGIDLWHEDVFTNGLTQKVSANGILCWNPLTDDGDALRLAVKLRIDVVHDDDDQGSNNAFVMAGNIDHVEYVNVESRREEATRRAIVRAAASIEKEMSREVCGICWCPYQEDWSCGCEPQTLDDAMKLPNAMAQAYENGYKAGAAARDAEHQQTLALQQRSYEREIELEVEAEREAIIQAIPGGHFVDPQWVCDMIRARSKE